MLKLSLEAIETVDAIDRHGSFAAAAARLNKVPSTISYAVGKLEEQLGMQLFDRKGPRVTLTAAGSEMLRSLVGSEMCIRDRSSTYEKISMSRCGWVPKPRPGCTRSSLSLIHI